MKRVLTVIGYTILIVFLLVFVIGVTEGIIKPGMLSPWDFTGTWEIEE